MTMPGLRATSVRRTVIVAVALVTGQALLGAVIGFMTFDRDEAGPAASRAAEPAAAPPIVAPAPSTPAATEASQPPGKRAVADASSGTRRVPASPAPAFPAPAFPAPASSAPAEAVTRPGTSPSPTRTSSAPAPLPPSSSAAPAPGLLPSPDADQPGAETPVAREPCEEEGATGRTGDGKTVRCRRDRDGRLRWRLV
ncbi:hypothetical protein [Actinoplanes sp. NPDC049316]|uniref:hypothetical protein n=1 Tax=Actinoplanes sp. NPDC049316 TaxID=3154727 RepID=UPI00342F8FEA